MNHILPMQQRHLVQVGKHFMASVSATDFQEAANKAICEYLAIHNVKHGDAITVYLIEPGSISHAFPMGKTKAFYQYQAIVKLEIIDDSEG